MKLTEAINELKENGYIISESNLSNNLQDKVKKIISYYNRYIGSDKLDKNYVQRKWNVFLGYTPDSDERKEIVDALIQKGYRADSFFYTDNVNHLVIGGKLDKKKQTAAKKIKDLMDSAGFNDYKELEKYIKNYI